MPLYLKEIFQNTASRVLLYILGFFVLMSGVYSYFNYKSDLKALEAQELSKLEAISRTLASQIDAKEHQYLYSKFPEKDDITKSDQNEVYQRLHELLKTVKKTNNLPTDVYTAVYKPETNTFDLVVTSSENPYFRHEWSKFHPNQVKKLKEGGVIERYNTENGTWLSSFQPLVTANSEVIGIVQVDMPFDAFEALATSSARKRAGIVGSILLFIGVLFYIVMVRFVRKEILIKKKLAFQHQQIALKNKSIIDSIRSAKRIQDSILPSINRIKEEFPEFFVVYMPKDIVSGDFFWYYRKGSNSYFAVSDCTGHGVPGAMMSMLGQSTLSDIIKEGNHINPADILNELDRRIAISLNHGKNSIAEGMDISLCRMSREEDVIEYSGAFRSLMQIRGKQMKLVKGDKFAIGGKTGIAKKFTNHIIKVNAGDRIYLYTDGYCDQFGGERGKKYMTKKFKDFILDFQDLRLEDQKYLIQYEFHHWKDEEEQVDDVLVAGFEIPGIDYSQTSFPKLKVVA